MNRFVDGCCVIKRRRCSDSEQRGAGLDAGLSTRMQYTIFAF
jgi:hypothetical protein